MVNRILVPLDGSKLAEGVLPYVAHIAPGAGASVTLFHVGPPAGALNGTLAPGYLDGVAETLKKEGMQVDTATVTGLAPLEIGQFALKNGYDLLAMSTHGRTGLNRWVYGSVTDRVLHTVDLPLLLVRPTGLEKVLTGDTPLRTVVTPLDGSRLAEAALPYAEALATRLGLEMKLIQVVPFLAMAYSGFDSHIYDTKLEEQLEEDARGYLARMEEGLRGRGIAVSSTVVRGYPAVQIMELTQATEGSLVVMSTHGRSGMKRWILGSVADRVLRASGRPVYLIRPEGVRIKDLEVAAEPSHATI